MKEQHSIYLSEAKLKNKTYLRMTRPLWLTCTALAVNFVNISES